MVTFPTPCQLSVALVGVVPSIVLGISGGSSPVPYRCFEGENMNSLTVRGEANQESSRTLM